MSRDRPRSSRRRYRKFVEDYRAKRLDALLEEERRLQALPLDRDGDGDGTESLEDAAAATAGQRARRRRYLREYFRWLEPHRWAVSAFILLALVRAGLEMIEPLFMRFMVDRVLLNHALETAARFARLNLAGTAFLTLLV